MREVALKGKKILILGAGAIAEAMIRGLTEADAVSPEQIVVTNKSNLERLQYLQETYRVSIVENLEDEAGSEALASADIILLACKPHDVANVLERIRDKVIDPVVLSVAAGVSTDLMESILGQNARVVRAMPNTACAVLESATAVSYGKHCEEETKTLAETILSVLGTVSVVEEKLMDVVTGLSGSGPAYFYYMVEAMQSAAENLGLPSDTARTLILQTLFGAGKMLQETHLDPNVLRRQVTSPNGTTMAGIRVFEEANFKELVERVITRAAERSREMGEQQASILQ
ncbi:pyrroline-5-carboxylate reductase [Effusibacillus lacus]|uniref:Pyrroline-5-carboxylate reductase n=1 Tax=Effusibacillus lacus TaxID=1348429 RepID=A0A292YCD3_9BACL|nr:pyrroline-5-carboxylate reductase [Effusibacillus lacus]TCS75539.1 pyrroline-5-carboxylate reductase [Effusibacillus lacus]GAX89002.1 pyrroline-5-carboxylate reductase [Effusibacillus lacus]